MCYGDEISLEAVIAAGVDQSEALISACLQGRDLGPGQRCYRGRAVIACLEQVAARHGQRDHQPEHRDGSGRGCGDQADVEPAVGAPVQPPLRPVQRVPDGYGSRDEDQRQRQPGRFAARRGQLRVRLRRYLPGSRQQRAAHQAGGFPQVGGPQRQPEPVVSARGLHLAGVDREADRQRRQVFRGS